MLRSLKEQREVLKAINSSEKDLMGGDMLVGPACPCTAFPQLCGAVRAGLQFSSAEPTLLASPRQVMKELKKVRDEQRRQRWAIGAMVGVGAMWIAAPWKRS
jgi:hypothetical protein